jgi:NAD(P)-dependent dehydrogenase (short-subunit alcohol dehydrogenase family)
MFRGIETKRIGQAVNYDLANEIVLVAGGGSAKGENIGHACSTMFGKAGAHVLIVDQSEEGGLRTVDTILKAGGRAKFFQADITNDQQVKNVIEEVKRQENKIDVFVNVVGKGGGNAPSKFSLARFSQALLVNTTGPIHVIQEALPLIGFGSSIVMINSINAFRCFLEIEYSMSKAALSCYVRNLAYELKSSGIRVNEVVCYSIQTKSKTMTDRLQEFSEYFEALCKIIYGGFRKWNGQPIGEPEDVAALVLFLASKKHSGWISGQSFHLGPAWGSLPSIDDNTGTSIEDWPRWIKQLFELFNRA